jgi:hypothetical protein
VTLGAVGMLYQRSLLLAKVLGFAGDLLTAFFSSAFFAFQQGYP